MQALTKHLSSTYITTRLGQVIITRNNQFMLFIRVSCKIIASIIMLTLSFACSQRLIACMLTIINSVLTTIDRVLTIMDHLLTMIDHVLTRNLKDICLGEVTSVTVSNCPC